MATLVSLLLYVARSVTSAASQISPAAVPPLLQSAVSVSEVDWYMSKQLELGSAALIGRTLLSVVSAADRTKFEGYQTFSCTCSDQQQR